MTAASRETLYSGVTGDGRSRLSQMRSHPSRRAVSVFTDPSSRYVPFWMSRRFWAGLSHSGIFASAERGMKSPAWRRGDTSL